MFWSELYVQDHKRQTDCAIHRACSQLALDPLAFMKFQELIVCARQRAPRLFEAPCIDGHHLGVEALVHLARFHGSHLRSASEWQGSSSTWRPAVASFADHLICGYRVPVFLASCWYGTQEGADRRREWFVAHARGASFRSLDLPMTMTRRMEHIFLASQHHLSINHALRRAELLALGASAGLVKAVLSTRLANDLNDGDFWRTVWMFLIAHEDELDSDQIAPLIDYILAVREEHGQGGLKEFGAPRPAFSIKGRTVPSMLRQMQEWHKSLGVGAASLMWARSPLEPLLLEELDANDPERSTRWQIVELINSGLLLREGRALHHCVASYSSRCHRGISSIWSLRYLRDQKVHHVLTIEVDPKRRAVVQARGWCNRTATGKPLRLLQEWAGRERLQMAL